MVAGLLAAIDASPAAQAASRRAARALPEYAAPVLPYDVLAVEGRRMLSRPQHERAAEALEICREADALLAALFERVATLPADGLEVAPVKSAGALRGILGQLHGELTRLLDRHEYGDWRLKQGLPLPVAAKGAR
jgi:hypothetical protein